MYERKARRISGPQIVQIAEAIPVCTRTVERVYEGAGNAYSRERVTRAARELGLPLPPPAADPSGAS
jgi:DNA-binding LacI/PurR family transcriptional regulator